MEATVSARQRLLFGRRRRRDEQVSDFGFKLSRVETGASGEPVFGSQLQVTVAGPVRQDADEVSKVSFGLQAVKPGGGDEGEEVAGAGGVVITSDEKPRLSADSNFSQLSFTSVVVQQQPTSEVRASRKHFR